MLPAALAARDAGRCLVVPRVNAEEASLANELTVIAGKHLLELVGHFTGTAPLVPFKANGLGLADWTYPDLSEVQGQEAAKRALLVAATGAHNLLMLSNNTLTLNSAPTDPPWSWHLAIGFDTVLASHIGRKWDGNNDERTAVYAHEFGSTNNIR